MQKLIAVAALCAASFAMPVLPTQAAPLTDTQADCLIFPMFKKACWELGAEQAAAVPAAFVATTSAAVDAADTAADKADWPFLWNCSRAAEGSGYLLDC